jgi:hypothetical protein
MCYLKKVVAAPCTG